MLLFPTQFGAQRNVIYDLIDEHIVDGLVILGSVAHFISPEEQRNFYRRFHPLPMVNVSIAVEGVPSVVVDNERGTRDALLHLIETHGYRRIAFIQGPEGNQEAEQRYRMYREALAGHGLAFDPDLVAPGVFEPNRGQRPCACCATNGKQILTPWRRPMIIQRWGSARVAGAGDKGTPRRGSGRV